MSCGEIEYETKTIPGIFAFHVRNTLGDIENIRELKAFLKRHMGAEYLKYNIYKNNMGALLFKFYDGMLPLSRNGEYIEVYGFLENEDVLICRPESKWLARVSGAHFAVHFKRRVSA